MYKKLTQGVKQRDNRSLAVLQDCKQNLKKLKFLTYRSNTR